MVARSALELREGHFAVLARLLFVELILQFLLVVRLRRQVRIVNQITEDAGLAGDHRRPQVALLNRRLRHIDHGLPARLVLVHDNLAALRHHRLSQTSEPSAVRLRAAARCDD